MFVYLVTYTQLLVEMYFRLSGLVDARNMKEWYGPFNSDGSRYGSKI